MTNLIDDIKRDRETGTSGPWVAKKSAFEVFNVDHGSMKYEITADLTLIAALYSSDIDANARRIARVPAMEAALLAAVDALEALKFAMGPDGELEDCSKAMELCSSALANLEAGQ